MKYLKIQNKGELDIRLLFLIGGTTKNNNSKQIGQFGTGLKYAITYLMRNEIDFSFFIGERKLSFTIKEDIISENEVNSILCDNEPMNITTHYGYQWQAWEAIRELWCNAIDAGNAKKRVIDNRSKIVGSQGTTTIYIPYTEDIEKVVNNWDNYFINREPIFEDDKLAIYLNKENNLKLYKNKVLIKEYTYYKSLFCYDFKETELNELRQYQGYLTSDICTAILKSNNKVTNLLLQQFKADKKDKDKEYMELSLDFDFMCKYSAPIVREIFQGWLFIHYDSTAQAKGNKAVKVNKPLFKILQRCKLPCEKLMETSGRYFSSSGYGDGSSGNVTFKEVDNVNLKERISKILNRYNSNISYSIAVSTEDDFEILFDEKKGDVIFNSDLDKLNNDDLESSVLIAIFNKENGNIYKAFKRLIRFTMKNRNFKRILFGV